MKMVTYDFSPCLVCTRVRDPQDCENKNCKAWQKWFLGRWAAIRAYPRVMMDCAKREPVGVVVSGTHYAAPHQVEDFQKNDPCKGCLCPKDLCETPCRQKTAWQKAVNL